MPPARKRCAKCKEWVELIQTARGQVYSCLACGHLTRAQKVKEVPELQEVGSHNIDEGAAPVAEVVQHRRRLVRARAANEREGPLAWVGDQAAYIGVGGFLVLGLFLFALCGLPVMIVLPAFCVVIAFVGLLGEWTGRIWIAVLAYQESPTMAVGCFLCAPVGLFYAVMNIGENWRQLLLMVLGFMLAVIGLSVGGALGYVKSGAI